MACRMGAGLRFEICIPLEPLALDAGADVAVGRWLLYKMERSHLACLKLLLSLGSSRLSLFISRCSLCMELNVKLE